MKEGSFMWKVRKAMLFEIKRRDVALCGLCGFILALLSLIGRFTERDLWGILHTKQGMLELIIPLIFETFMIGIVILFCFKLLGNWQKTKMESSNAKSHSNFH